MNLSASAGEIPTVLVELIPSELNIELSEALVLKEKQLDEYTTEELRTMLDKKVRGEIYGR